MSLETPEAVEQEQKATQAPEQTAPVDPLDAEIAAAEAAVKAEQEAKAAQAPEGTAEAAQPTKEVRKEEPKEEPKVPVSAVYKERKARQALELQVAHLTGQVQALSAAKPSADHEAEEAKPEPPNDDPLQGLYSQVDALAERFDAGELSMREFKAQERALQDQIDTIKTERAQATAQQQDPTLEEFTVKLAEQYPVITKLTEGTTSALVALAYEQAEQSQDPIPGGLRGTMILRERVAKLAQTLYGQPATTTTTPPGTQQPLSPQAAVRAAALEKQAQMPPEVSTMGSAGSSAIPSDAEFLANVARMTDDDAIRYLDSLPLLKNRLMGGARSVP